MNEVPNYPRTSLLPTIQIESIISLFYFEFTKDYIFQGERHNFWEMLYVDKGEVEVSADSTVHPLRQGMMIFHKPDEFHSIHANRVTAPNLIVMSFECHSPAMRHFENQVISLGDEERNLLALIMEEGARAFYFPFRIPLKRREDAPVGSEQLVQLYLTTLLIRLLRQVSVPQAKLSGESIVTTAHGDPTPALSAVPKEKQEEDYVHQLIVYMKSKLSDKLSLTEMSDVVHLSPGRLQLLFKQKTGYTIMDYFGKLKIDEAKTYIREETMNITEIAQQLGFGSVHSFSKAFKKITDMSPTEYAKSVKARVRANHRNDPQIDQPVTSKPSATETPLFTDHCIF